MTGNHTGASARAHTPPHAAQAIESAEQQLFILQHELQLLADLATAGRDDRGAPLSLESLATVLGSYAERIRSIRFLMPANDQDEAHRAAEEGKA